MASKIYRLSDYDKLFNNYKKFGSQNSSFTGKDSCPESISDRLQKLPKIKASPGFDQKMAAAFAIELEKETLQRNRSWLKKHPQISLPDVVTDLTKNF